MVPTLSYPSTRYLTTATFFGTLCKSHRLKQRTHLSLKSAKSAHGFGTISPRMAHQPHQTQQSPSYSATLSPQISLTLLKSTAISEPSSCPHAASRPPGSSYQRKVPGTNGDDSAHTALSTQKCASPGPTLRTVPKSYSIPSNNLDTNGKPLTYASTKRGPDRLAWANKAEAEEIIRLILSGTIVPIAHTLVPQERWNSNEIVYYNPVVKQTRNDDGSIQFRVQGTAGGNLLTIPYDVSARTASLDTVKLLVHSVISGNYSWMTIDIADFYLGPPTIFPIQIPSNTSRQDTHRNFGQVQSNSPTV